MKPNSPNQDHDLPNKNQGKEMRNQESGLATNGEKGDHGVSPRDAQPTQFSLNERDKVPTAVPETL